MKQILLLFSIITLTFSGCTAEAHRNIQYSETHPLVEAAREQIGVVTHYDSGYYDGGYPPKDRGACVDVIVQALEDNGYEFKKKIDTDIKKHPSDYPQVSDTNINFRRVRNIQAFFEKNAESLPTCTSDECFKNNIWKAGDIVTFDQIPGGLWHIAIISNKSYESSNGSKARIPFLIHNHGRGTVENDYLLDWPSPISGHYRMKDIGKT